jgi:hypothetical protein
VGEGDSGGRDQGGIIRGSPPIAYGARANAINAKVIVCNSEREQRCASQQNLATNVRFGSKADIRTGPRCVRHSSSGSLAIFAAIRRASSQVNLHQKTDVDGIAQKRTPMGHSMQPTPRGGKRVTDPPLRGRVLLASQRVSGGRWCVLRRPCALTCALCKIWI